MQYSLVEAQNGSEIERVRDMEALSLQPDQDPPPNFQTINSIDVPVNQEIAWEFTRFKSKKRVYKNPNLSQIHSKSAIDPKPPGSKNQRKSRPDRHGVKPGVNRRSFGDFQRKFTIEYSTARLFENLYYFRG